MSRRQQCHKRAPAVVRRRAAAVDRRHSELDRRPWCGWSVEWRAVASLRRHRRHSATFHHCGTCTRHCPWPRLRYSSSPSSREGRPDCHYRCTCSARGRSRSDDRKCYSWEHRGRIRHKAPRLPPRTKTNQHPPVDRSST